MHGRILVVGATGTVGSAVVAGLIRRGERVRMATRDPAKAAARRGETGGDVDAVEFDLERPATFGPALIGVDRVFLIARPGDEEADRVALPLIEEMRRLGVRHVVDVSAMGVEQREDLALRKIELALEASGMAFTHLRPNFFMQVFLGGALLAGIRASGSIAIPAADARISYVDVGDIAGVAVTALTADDHRGKAYTLTGPAALDHHEVARLLSEASGRPIRYVAIDEEAARRAILAAGLSEQRAERLIGFYRLVRAGFCAPVSMDVSSVLGRPATPFEAFARDHAVRWA